MEIQKRSQPSNDNSSSLEAVRNVSQRYDKSSPEDDDMPPTVTPLNQMDMADQQQMEQSLHQASQKTRIKQIHNKSAGSASQDEDDS